ncbi:hypothetical protein Plhal304r1_c089g0170801 [Plasmopara halstedii]
MQYIDDLCKTICWTAVISSSLYELDGYLIVDAKSVEFIKSKILLWISDFLLIAIVLSEIRVFQPGG